MYCSLIPNPLFFVSDEYFLLLFSPLWERMDVTLKKEFVTQKNVHYLIGLTTSFFVLIMLYGMQKMYNMINIYCSFIKFYPILKFLFTLKAYIPSARIIIMKASQYLCFQELLTKSSISTG